MSDDRKNLGTPSVLPSGQCLRRAGSATKAASRRARILQDFPNLIARPMCFFVHTIPADQIRSSVKYAVTHAHEPAQLQYCVFARELRGEFDTLLGDTFRANKIGVALYQFPGVMAADKSPAAIMKAARDSRALQKRFLADAFEWNALLNEAESMPIIVPARAPPEDLELAFP